MKKYFLIIIILLICVISIFSIYKNKKDVYKVSKIGTINKNINYYKGIYKNNDILGVLKIDGTSIFTPTPRGNDNSYYLSHDLYKKDDIKGTVFIDYRTNENTRKLIFYGHTSPDLDTLFNQLEEYYDINYYLKHKYIDVNINDNYRKYEIFSVFVETSDWSYLNINFDDDSYLEHLNKLKKKSIYDTSVNISNKKTIVLQGCSRNPKYKNYKDKYVVIVGIEKESN